MAHYKEFGGWSNAAKDLILALDSIGIDVVCRNIKLTGANNEVPDRILELEQKDLLNVTHCIQHLLPHHLIGSNNFKKNIAYFVDETIHFRKNIWHMHLNLVDEVMVPNNQMKENLSNLIKPKVSYVPHAVDIDKLKTSIETESHNPFSSSQLQNAYKFYTITEWSNRKNIESIIKAYLSEFTKQDNTVLILKVNKFGLQPRQVQEIVQNHINEIVKIMRIYKNDKDIPRIICIPDKLTDEDIVNIHKACDCFVLPSHGEAWSIPSFISMAYGNTPICSNEGGPKEFIDANNVNTGSLISGTLEIPKSTDQAFDFIYTGKEAWFKPNEIELKSKMRFYYENQIKNNQDGIMQASKFDYTIVGNMIKGILNNE